LATSVGYRLNEQVAHSRKGFSSYCGQIPAGTGALSSLFTIGPLQYGLTESVMSAGILHSNPHKHGIPFRDTALIAVT